MSRDDWSDLSKYPERHRGRIDAELRGQGKVRDALGDRGLIRPVEGAKKKRTSPEQDMQIAIVTLADQMPMPFTPEDAMHWPRHVRNARVGEYLIHIPNGGGRSKAEGGIFKAMGVRKGVADLLFMLPVLYLGGFGRAGLWTELKVDGKLTPEQEQFRDRVTAVGYGWSEARSVDQWHVEIKQYLRHALPLINDNGG